MSDFNVNIFQHRGSSYKIGLNLGQQIAGTPIIDIFENITREQIDVTNMKAIYSTFSPHLLEELEGLAEGAQIPWQKAAALFSGFDVPRPEAMGCSAMVTNAYYVRNYDFSPALYDGYFSLIQPEEGFASAGYNLQVLGRHDAVNQHGLVVGLHFVSNNGYTEGISAWITIRMVLDTCSTVTDAIEMLREIPHAACYNFSMGDKKGNIAVVEASPDSVIVRKDESYLTCVNHFQDKSQQHNNRSVINNSEKRHTYIQSIKNEQLTQQEAFDHFRDKKSPLFYTDYEELFGTLHTFAYDFKDSRLLTAIAQSSQIIDINFDDWVAGKAIRDQNLQGIIE
ncbi:C45 family autoproteolytic acyltransferase/hydolase [Virgibacillus salinus]|uniref:Predicted choloylglycine hydrolase n=1 Tax=Virgibacillus salinus TaxID=553311 RepID=A0A1H0XU21_9BACI|nr:C45 family peptidase [Virgibacillus salinus]SDQ06427.1 Predicted choloylglycine hydrolase [Virgibacillus salinus]